MVVMATEKATFTCICMRIMSVYLGISGGGARGGGDCGFVDGMRVRTSAFKCACLAAAAVAAVAAAAAVCCLPPQLLLLCFTLLSQPVFCTKCVF